MIIKDRSVSEIEDNFSHHFVATDSASSSSPNTSLLPSTSSNFNFNFPPSSSSPPHLISPRPLRSHNFPLDDGDPECQMPEHSAEHSDENSLENSTHRKSPRSQFLQTNAFAAKRKHSIKEEEEEGQVGTVEAEEQFDGVDTDTIEAMRVGKSPSRAGNSRFRRKGTFCILLDQYFTLK